MLAWRGRGEPSAPPLRRANGSGAPVRPWPRWVPVAETINVYCTVTIPLKAVVVVPRFTCSTVKVYVPGRSADTRPV